MAPEIMSLCMQGLLYIQSGQKWTFAYIGLTTRSKANNNTQQNMLLVKAYANMGVVGPLHTGANNHRLTC